jgi:hypothetical protein
MRRHSIAIPTVILYPFIVLVIVVGKTNGWTNGAMGSVILGLMAITVAIGTLMTPRDADRAAQRRERRPR